MDIKYLEEKFIQLHKDLYGENEDITFYVPTCSHSSGFNEVKIFKMDDGDYNVEEECDGCGLEDFLTFEGIVKEYPDIALDINYAFNGRFETWEDIELAFKGKKEINLVRL